MISQTVQFMGCTAHRLYDAYMSSAEHAAMTVDGTQAAAFRRGSVDVAKGAVGDELRAFGRPGGDGELVYSLHASVLEERTTSRSATNLPDYKVRIPDTGEVGPLSQIVNTHWSLLYWEPMRHYFATGPG